ncbi:carbamoyl phosphate synthase small subunit [Lactococcus lactis]|uniref:carbamoyl phosphate synthase small subunit n=1 Tax=Lactococcus lactis TaxID=1358 RepID=UPI0015C37860|nr:carbamoyl phosphate synthase small subunit [Lactococcus lactis]QLF89813.1 glutamine-hydrolyzing carbamoyl-phosphate synthase small subunit [Lactococcus lactis subsp. lactis]
MSKRLLILEDGTIFEGESLGANLDVTGELVFNTGMTGYQESITDQSYNGQILTFTYPIVGNYGVNRDDYESIHPTCKAVVVHEAARRPSNWRMQMSFDEFLKSKNIPGITGVDTRAITKIVREHGTMKASLVQARDEVEHQMSQLQATVLPTNQVETSSTTTAYPSPNTGRKVVVVDFGLKHSILRELSKRECNLTVVPYNTSAKEILEMEPDGVMLTNGPGDPTDVPEAIEMIKEIQGKIPIFGICLGHQLFSLANGAKTYKMKFGHRGLNHAVREIATGRIDFTSQNHGYAVSSENLPEDLMITHVEINDDSVEGVRHKHFPAFSVQFHPDAAPGPHDASYLFDDFIDLMDNFKK